jgi:hypothetical protein
MRVLNGQGECVYELNLRGNELTKHWASHLGLGFYTREDGTITSMSGSCLYDFGNLACCGASSDVKHFIELAARKLNYHEAWDIKPFLIVDELDDTTVIFQELGGNDGED